MIGLDTNLVVRWLVEDPGAPQQNEIARRTLAEAEDGIFLHDIVLAESAWVMSALMRMPRAAIARVFLDILDHPKVSVARPGPTRAALIAYETGGPGLSDQLIGHLNHAAGCRTTLTFDKQAGSQSHFTPVS